MGIKNYSHFKIAAFITAGIAIALLVTSFFIPPIGTITPSALQGAAELIGIIAIFFGWEAVDKGLDAKITHRNTTIEIINDENKEDKNNTEK